jgi:hypothetical protein
MKHFSSLPVGMACCNAVDTLLLESKKDKIALDKIAVITKEMASGTTLAVNRSMDATKIIAHHSRLRKDMFAVLGNCTPNFIANHEDKLKTVCEGFELVVALLGTIHITAFDRALSPVLTRLVVLLDTAGDDPCDQACISFVRLCGSIWLFVCRCMVRCV